MSHNCMVGKLQIRSMIDRLDKKLLEKSKYMCYKYFFYRRNRLSNTSQKKHE